MAPHLRIIYERYGRRPDWMDQAACAGEPAEIFFPESEQDADLAKAICQGCPVKADCLAYALEVGKDATDAGVWGGATEQERRAIRRKIRRERSKARSAARDNTVT